MELPAAAAAVHGEDESRSSEPKKLSVRETLLAAKERHPEYFANLTILHAENEGSEQEVVHFEVRGTKKNAYEGGVWRGRTVFTGQFYLDTPCYSRSVVGETQYFWASRAQREDRLVYLNKRFTPLKLPYEQPASKYARTYGNDELDAVRRQNRLRYSYNAYRSALTHARRPPMSPRDAWAFISRVVRADMSKALQEPRRLQKLLRMRLDALRNAPVRKLMPSWDTIAPLAEVVPLPPPLEGEDEMMAENPSRLRAGVTTVDDLPAELWREILERVPFRRRVALMCVCTQWAQLILSNSLLLFEEAIVFLDAYKASAATLAQELATQRSRFEAELIEAQLRLNAAGAEGAAAPHEVPLGPDELEVFLDYYADLDRHHAEAMAIDDVSAADPSSDDHLDEMMEESGEDEDSLEGEDMADVEMGEEADRNSDSVEIGERER